MSAAMQRLTRSAVLGLGFALLGSGCSSQPAPVSSRATGVTPSAGGAIASQAGRDAPGTGATSGTPGLIGAMNAGQGATLMPKPSMQDAADVLRGGCATSSVQTQLVPSNLLFVIDRSGSMACNPPPLTASPDCERDPLRADPSQPSKWEITRDALKTAIGRLPASTRVGMSYFSNDDSCGVNSTPSVAIAALSPEQLSALGSSLDGVQPAGGTPLVGATVLAYKHLHDLALRGLTAGNDFVVLLTDGQQSEQCGSPMRCQSAQECVDLLLGVEVPKSAGPGAEIRTFVIGAPGSEPARPVLSQIAVKGNTAAAGCNPDAHDCHLDMTKQSDFSAALSAALAAISGEATRCELPLPIPDDDAGALDLTRLNVVFTPSGGKAKVFPRDERAACDAGADGWQFDASQGHLRLCGDACRQVHAEPSARVDVVLGCPVQGPA